MTREEVLAMEAGEKLDAYVLHYVHGIDKWGIWVEENGSPSTNISTAWQVVEKMPPPFQIHRCLDDTYWAVFGFDTWIKPHIVARAAPEAICKAALLAKLEVRS